MASLVIPEDVLIEILVRLPPESLLQFKFVQKSWYALINDPKFAAKHFSNSSWRKHVLLLYTHIRTEENSFSFFKLPISPDPSVSFFNINFPFDEDVKWVEIRGHSHGLICITVFRRDIWLWNPLTGELRKIPPSILLRNGTGTRISTYEKAVGFGYDSKSRDFKVVRVVDFREEHEYFSDEPEYFHPPRVEIYELSKDRWREIETPYISDRSWRPSFKMYHEGTCYWLGFTHEDTEIIETFNLSDEIFGQIQVPEDFGQIQVPEDMVDKLLMQKCLGVFKESIVLIHSPLNRDWRRINMWAMEKEENGVSWSKIFTIGSIFGIEKGWMMVNSDELFMEANEGQLILYNNSENQHLKEQLPARFFATVFVKSLISVKGGNNISYEF